MMGERCGRGGGAVAGDDSSECSDRSASRQYSHGCSNRERLDSADSDASSTGADFVPPHLMMQQASADGTHHHRKDKAPI